MERLLNRNHSACYLCVLHCILYMHRLLLCIRISQIYIVSILISIHSQLFKYNCSMESRETHWSMNEITKKNAITFSFVGQSIHRTRKPHTSTEVWIVILLKFIFVFVSMIVFTVFIRTMVNTVLCVFPFWVLWHVQCSIYNVCIRITHCGWFHEQAF